ncbi:uncharacterized protein LOC111013810 [Momordica charantia]|uniref:Uncharacterized protein LOC111013810 n=1 Tax=Momordica charantia TaxID=3673 RepID=A0A6J1CR25_MOMCH|nr:uncharacterized protein LOC111013810 [Momordica charantia]
MASFFEMQNARSTYALISLSVSYANSTTLRGGAAASGAAQQNSHRLSPLLLHSDELMDLVDSFLQQLDFFVVPFDFDEKFALFRDRLYTDKILGTFKTSFSLFRFFFFFFSQLFRERVGCSLGFSISLFFSGVSLALRSSSSSSIFLSFRFRLTKVNKRAKKFKKNGYPHYGKFMRIFGDTTATGANASASTKLLSDFEDENDVGSNTNFVVEDDNGQEKSGKRV